MKQGANDPDRWNLYQKMVADTWGIADQSRLLMLDNASSKIGRASWRERVFRAV